MSTIPSFSSTSILTNPTLSASSPSTPTYADCVSALRTSLSLLEASVSTLGAGVADYPRLGTVLKTVRHFELIPQPTLAAAEASLRDEIGPFVAALFDRAGRQLDRQERRIETLRARADLNAGRLSSAHHHHAGGTNTTSSESEMGADKGGDRGQQLAAGAATRGGGGGIGPKGQEGQQKGPHRRLDGEAALRAKMVRQRKEALQYGVERLELEVAQKERELRMRLEAA